MTKTSHDLLVALIGAQMALAEHVDEDVQDDGALKRLEQRLLQAAELAHKLRQESQD